jgi:hypothetical protein
MSTNPLTTIFSSTSSLWTHHPKIKKISTAGGGKAWQVYDHMVGTRHFSTWEQARDYALAELELVWEPGRCPNAGNPCNCIGACQPRRVWRVAGAVPQKITSFNGAGV